MATQTQTPTTQLRRDLDRLGLSQKQLAAATGIGEATISRYANGLRPTVAHGEAINYALGRAESGGLWHLFDGTRAVPFDGEAVSD